MPKAQAYNITMYIMAGLLVIGFICNSLIKAVHHRFHMQPDHEAVRGQVAVAAAGEPAGAADRLRRTLMANQNQTGTTTLQLALAWGFVGIPLAWGVLQTLITR